MLNKTDDIGGMQTAWNHDAIEYCAIFTHEPAGCSEAWHRTCFGSPEALSGVGLVGLNSGSASE
jgi:hypothetical protein